MVIKHTRDTVDLLTDVPQSGIWAMNPTDRSSTTGLIITRAVAKEVRGALPAILNAGDYRYEGADWAS
jgi:hypothetical protein